MKTTKVEALLHPTSVAILGARENPSGWTARIFSNLARFGFAGPVYPINPRLPEVWGVRCYPDLAALPAPADHLVVMRAAQTVADALRDGARLGARSATVYSAGFAEIGTEEGRRLQAELVKVIAETGLAVSGPNCLGNLSAPARLLSLPDDRMQEMAVGPVAIVGQSGTATPAIARKLMDRGIGVSYVVTSGNEIDLATADYIDFYATDPKIRVIFCMIEAVRRREDFLAACGRARDAGKPVVALKMGGSVGGREAALAHTGSLAGAVEAFEAVAGAAGVIRAVTADEAVNLVELLVATPPPRGRGVGVLVYSGGLAGLAVDAAERHGMPLQPFAPETSIKLRKILGEHARIANPLDAASFVNLALDDIIALIVAVRDDSGVDTVLLQEDVPPGEGANEANKRRARRVLTTLEAIDQRLASDGGKPIGLISVNSTDLTEFGRKERSRFPHIAALNEPDRALRTLRAAIMWREWHNAAAGAGGEGNDNGVSRILSAPARIRLLAQWRALPSSSPLSEPQSKALLRAYGVHVPDEHVASTIEEAVSAAERIGYPVVVKAVAAQLTHKSDAGAVMLGLTGAADVREACEKIAINLANYDSAIALEGFLVARHVTGGIELVLGIQNAPEMGPVVMFGAGGVLLELTKDVAFAAPGLSRSEARALIGRTRAGALLKGYRGRGPFDAEAVVDAIVAVGRMAAEVGEAMQSMDINPLVALSAGQGVVALDALVIVGDTKHG